MTRLLSLVVTVVAACSSAEGRADSVSRTAPSTDASTAIVATEGTDTVVRVIPGMMIRGAPSDSLVGDEPAFHTLRVWDDLFVFNHDGRGTRNGVGALAFSVPVDSGFRIEQLWLRPVPGGLLVVYQFTSGGEGMGVVMELDSATLAPRWPRSARVSLNLGPLLVTESAVFVSGLDVVGLIDRSTGQFRWRHVLHQEDQAPWPGRGGHFTVFGDPMVVNDVAAFPELPGYARRGDRVDTVRVRIGSGELLAPSFLVRR